MSDDQEFGYGQQDPSDFTSDSNMVQFYIRQAIAQLATCKIVKVTAVDTSARTVDIQPLVKLLDGRGYSSQAAQVFGIPYAFAQGGAAAVLIDPAVGDIGVMVCCDRDISVVKSTKAVANPGSYRKLNAADGIYLFGLPGLNGDVEQWVKFTDTGLELHDKNGNKLTSDSTGWKFTGNVTMSGNLQLAGSILDDGGGTYAGNLSTSGDVVAGNISLKNHHHTAQGATAPTTAAQP